MSDSVPLPTPSNQLVALERLREELARLKKDAIGRDELIRSGLAAKGADGRLITSSDLLSPVQTTILGLQSTISGAASAVERMETRVGQVEDGFEVAAQRLTQLDAEMRIVSNDVDGNRATLVAQAQAQQDLQSRVFANEQRVEITSQNVTRLFSQLTIDGGLISELGTGITANADAINDLSTRITVEQGRIDVLAQDVTTLRADLTIAESNITGLTGTVAAQGTAINNLSTRVTATEGGIQTVSQNLTTLTGRVSTAEGNIVANANATTSLTTRVSAAEGTLTSQGTLITNLTNRVSNAETGISGNATAITNLTSTVTSQGNAITAQVTETNALRTRVGTAETAITTNRQAQINGDQINASAIEQVSLSLSGTQATVTLITEVQAGTAAVIIFNPSFETSEGWGGSANSSTLPAGVSYQTTTAARTGARALRFDANATIYGSGRTRVRSGERLRVGVYRRSAATAPNSGAALRVGIVQFDAAGALISGSGLQAAGFAATGANFTDWPDLSGLVTITNPATVFVCPYVQVAAMTSGAVIFDDVYIERISRADERAMAAVTLELDVNGRQIGTRTENDGVRGGIINRVDYWRLESPSGTSGTEVIDGIIRSYAGSAAVITGPGFGTNNLMMWVGPKVAATAATKANGIFWVDSTGSAYFKGAIIAGSIRNGGYTSSVAVNTSYSEGPFGTNGGPISVNASYSFSQIMTANNETATYSKGAGSNQATVQLWRKVGSGALEMVAQTTAAGSLDVVKEGGSPAQAIYSINGAITYTDTAGGTAQRTFEVRMLNRQQQVVNISGGSTVSTQTNQATGIQTAEA